jgi:NAD(P)-dependent dehydrogenase (short-subunit alcohol dehydrogenase family)
MAFPFAVGFEAPRMSHRRNRSLILPIVGRSSDFQNGVGTISEIAQAISFLVPKGASYVSGIVMPVDGGFLAAGAPGV